MTLANRGSAASQSVSSRAATRSQVHSPLRHVFGTTSFSVDPYQLGNDEALIVLSGRPTLRMPDGERVLATGDVAQFPRGPSGAQRFLDALYRDGGVPAPIPCGFAARESRAGSRLRGFSPDQEARSCPLEFAPIRRSRIGTKMGTKDHRFLSI